MGMIVKMALAFLWLVLIPTAAGSLFIRKNDFFSLGESFLAGYLFLFSLCEVLTLLMMYFNLPLTVLVVCYGAVLIAAGLFGCKRIYALKSSALPVTGKKQKKYSLFFWMAIILILMQIVNVVIFAHLDADDSVYVGAATSAIQSNTIFRINAYTGIPYVRLPRRYILSPFPIFLAIVSQLSAGMHPAIMAHTVFSAVFLAAAYLVLYQLSRKWFPDDINARGIFLLLCAILFTFTAYSVYNSGTFQMIRLWQGKAVLAAFMLPLVLYLSLSIVLEEKPHYSWLLYLMANISGCLLSSMGIILTPLMMGLFLLIGLIRWKSIKRTIIGLSCCIPSIILGAAYVLILVLRGRGIL